jgi:hypothetical protein
MFDGLLVSFDWAVVMLLSFFAYVSKAVRSYPFARRGWRCGRNSAAIFCLPDQVDGAADIVQQYFLFPMS